MSTHPTPPPPEVSTGRKIRVIDSLWTFAVAVAVVGPLALPLLWRNPRFSVKTKLAGTAFILALTGFLLWVTYQMEEMTRKHLMEFQKLGL
jgi:hypothetical protein